MKQVKFKINGMHCTSCSIRIDGDLEEIDGVKSANTDFIKGHSMIEFDETKTNEDVLKQVINNAGYSII